MSSFLWPDSMTRKAYNQGTTIEQIEARKARREAALARKAADNQQTNSVIAPVQKFLSGITNRVKKFFSRGKH